MNTLITATPPTPNGDLHLGHLSGPYLGADILRRFLRLRGDKGWYLTGIDDHQTYTERRGQEDRRSAAETADHFGDRIEEAWRRSGVAADVCVRPRRSAHHIAFVTEFFRRLADNGHVVARTKPLPYCVQCASPRFEAYVRGTCPHCGELAGGNACEDCGEPNDCADLTDASCTMCGERTVLRDVERLYFPLQRFEAALAQYWGRVDMPAHLLALCNSMLSQGLPEIAVSHPGTWGIPVPMDGFRDQRIYVWFEMAPGYLVEAEELASAEGDGDGWASFWKRDDVQIVQFFGFDNGYFHAVLFPALFLAFDPNIHLPDSFIVNEFYRLDGDKFSTSRNHAVWVRDALRDRPLDCIRYALTRDRPSVRQTNYSTVRAAMHTNRLRELWEGWIRDLGRRVVQYDAGRAPHCTEFAGSRHRDIHRYLSSLGDQVAESLEPSGFAPEQALRTLEGAIHRLWALGAEFEHLAARPDPDNLRSSAVALELAGADALSTYAYPFLPGAATRIRRAIGRPEPLPGDWWEAGRPVPTGSDISALAGLELFS